MADPEIEVFESDRPPDRPRRDEGLRRRARALLDSVDLTGRRVLDAGTGRGRLAFLLAPRCRDVLGIDIDARKIAEARARAARLAVGNARFEVADAEKQEYGALLSGLGAVVANLCMSTGIVRRAAMGLPPGGKFAFTCFHKDHWKETGSGSSFALDPGTVIAVARQGGLELVRGFVEVERHHFSSVEKLLALYVGQGSRGRKWAKDGRLAALKERAGSAGPSVTEAYFTALFEKTR